MPDEHGNVFRPASQWYIVNGENIQPVIEIFSEFAALDLRFQDLVGGGEDADIGAQGLIAADPGKLARTLAEGAYGVVRAKGWVQGRDGMSLIQIVGSQWEVTPAAPSARSGIVCIGPKDRLDIAGLKAL